MPSRTPPTYDEIVRRTVVDPDGSWRPSPAQETAAHEGFRALTPDERELHERVWQALVDTGLDLEHITIEVDGNTVTARGVVRNAFALRKLPEVIAKIDGVENVVDQLAIGTPQP
jgi:BON domain-containing protein